MDDSTKTYFPYQLKIGDPVFCTSQPTLYKKSKFSIKNFFNKCDQIRSFLRIWSHLLQKSLMENFILCAGVNVAWRYRIHIFSLF